NAWETLTFDFNNQASGTAAFDPTYPYDMASIFFNFGTDGATAGTKVYYFDDVMMATVTGPSQIDLPVTFDDPTVDYTMTDFGGNSSVLGPDPVNAANTVSITTKDVTAQLWAGTTIGTNLGFANVIPFTATNRSMTVAVYSPDAGIPVRLKAEVHGQPTQSVETEAMTTVANAWETLTFDFNNQASGTAAFDPTYPYDMASIFFNFGTDGATAGDKTYLWDDVAFGPAAVSIGDPLSESAGVYPNPVKNVLYVTIPESLVKEELTYSVTDMAGRVVMDKGKFSGIIHVENLANGVYTLQINTSNGLINKKFVKF
ncbi:MAG: T9SS type A sorting domain-containing protein, partial [Bacteroidia bacterium]|nr:T9SS type A sorting domain-containing protein [Bacteroidia bacterium]